MSLKIKFAVQQTPATGSNMQVFGIQEVCDK